MVKEFLPENSGTHLAVSWVAVGMLATIAALVLGSVRAPISAAAEQARVAERLRGLTAVAVIDHDNEPTTSYKLVHNPSLYRSEQPAVVAPLLKDGSAVGAVVKLYLPEGYGGGIELALGVDAGGFVTKVLVVSHNETPGFGAVIDESDWLDGFIGKSLATPPSRWQLRKFGGEFDGLSGASITASAIVTGVLRGLQSAAPTLNH
jgi:electron transport complex protein RnfG